MKTMNLLVALVLVLMPTAGCDKGPTKHDSAASVTTGPASATGLVQIPPDGRKFEPPVKPEQLPAGAWYCDMGTVHWAQMKEGDKTCPVCKMNLVQKN